MKAQMYNIVGRVANDRLGTWASLDLYKYEEAGIVDADIVLTEPGWSPYCLNSERNTMAFIQVPIDIDLSQAPFVVFTQFKQAKRMLLIGLDAVNYLAADLPEPDNLLMIFMIGRSGSTLLNQILSRIEGVGSYSEPEVFKHLTLVAQYDPVSAEGWRNVIQSTVRIWQYINRHNHTLGLKFARLANDILPQYYDAFPDAKYIFSYRQGLSWAQSNYDHLQRTYPELEVYPRIVPASLLRVVWRDLMSNNTATIDTLCADTDEAYIEDFYAAGWQYFMERYEQALLGGIPGIGIEFEELVNERETTIDQLIYYCNLPENARTQALSGFDRHSQAGTYYAPRKKRRMSDTQVERFLQRLRPHPRFNTPNAKLSNGRA